jgi:hypothetical protein
MLAERDDERSCWRSLIESSLGSLRQEIEMEEVGLSLYWYSTRCLFIELDSYIRVLTEVV